MDRNAYPPENVADWLMDSLLTIDELKDVKKLLLVGPNAACLEYLIQNFHQAVNNWAIMNAATLPFLVPPPATKNQPPSPDAWIYQALPILVDFENHRLLQGDEDLALAMTEDHTQQLDGLAAVYGGVTLQVPEALQQLQSGEYNFQGPNQDEDSVASTSGKELAD